MGTPYTWEPVRQEATEMTLRNRGIPSRFAGMAVPLLERAMRRAITTAEPA